MLRSPWEAITVRNAIPEYRQEQRLRRMPQAVPMVARKVLDGFGDACLKSLELSAQDGVCLAHGSACARLGLERSVGPAHLQLEVRRSNGGIASGARSCNAGARAGLRTACLEEREAGRSLEQVSGETKCTAEWPATPGDREA